MKKEKIMLFWSGGKDSALALHYLKANPLLEIVGLITILNKESNTVSFHGIPDSLLKEQAAMLKLPLQRIFLSGELHEALNIIQIRELLSKFANKGIKAIAFGTSDNIVEKQLFESLLLPLEMRAYFPLGHLKSESINIEFLKLGLKALVTAINEKKLDKSFLNCELNQEFLDRMPLLVESDSFHCFVLFIPGFKSRIAFSKSIAVVQGTYLVSLLKEP